MVMNSKGTFEEVLHLTDLTQGSPECIMVESRNSNITLKSLKLDTLEFRLEEFTDVCPVA